jgi:hypothetical protein
MDAGILALAIVARIVCETWEMPKSNEPKEVPEAIHNSTVQSEKEVSSHASECSLMGWLAKPSLPALLTPSWSLSIGPEKKLSIPV